jgi:hypothetical protein
MAAGLVSPRTTALDGEEALANNFSFTGIIEPKQKRTASLMKPNCAKQTLNIIISVSDAIRFNELLTKFIDKKQF